MNWVHPMEICKKLFPICLNFIKFVFGRCLRYIKGNVLKMCLNFYNVTKRKKMSFWTKLWLEMKLGFTISHLKRSAARSSGNIAVPRHEQSVVLFHLQERWWWRCFSKEKVIIAWKSHKIRQKQYYKIWFIFIGLFQTLLFMLILCFIKMLELIRFYTWKQVRKYNFVNHLIKSA